MEKNYLINSTLFSNTHEYLLLNTHYDFITGLLQSMPFFWVWLASIIVWFLIDLSTYYSHSFNTKHTYLNNLSRAVVFTNHYNALMQVNLNSTILLKVVTRHYL